MPLGVVAVVYEARPNVTIDCSALCLKSGNAIVLRGSSMAAQLERGARGSRAARRSRPSACPRAAVSIVAGGDRDELRQLATQDGVVDLIIPRGGEGLKNALKEHATVPVLYAASGNCHLYVDASADLDKAVAIAINAKVQRPGVCNAIETLLVHSDVAADVPAARAARAARARRGAARRRARARRSPARSRDSLLDATEEDWATEFHALILAVRVVDSADEAIEHVNHWSSGHSEAIVTGSTEVGARGSRRTSTRRRLRQRVDALHRRRPVRDGRRDRQLDPEAARARADRPARAVHVQVRRRRRRAGSAVARADRHLRRDVQPAAHRSPDLRAGGVTPSSSSTWSCSCRWARRRTARSSSDPGAEVRFTMCEHATSADARFGVSRIELDRDGPSYTVDTLRELREQRPDDELFLILGGDQAAALPSWHEPRRGAVAGDGRGRRARPSTAARRSPRRVRSVCGDDARVVFFDMPRIDVSSTLVRGARRPGKPIRYLVPDKVANYIGAQSLYGVAPAGAA